MIGVEHELTRNAPAHAAILQGVLATYVVPKTSSNYSGMALRYVNYCKILNMQPFPADGVKVSAWILRLMTSVKPTSLKVYLAAVRFAQINLGLEWKLDGDVTIHRTRRWCKRNFPCGGKALKVAVSLAVLRQILPHLPGWPSLTALSYADLLFACASVIGCCGFLRGGEFLYKLRQSRPILLSSHISVSTIRGTPCLVVRVPQPKEEWWSEAVNVPIFQSSDPASPFNPLLLWKELGSRSRHVDQGVPSSSRLPAFHNADGSPLRRDVMATRTTQLLIQAGIGVVDPKGRPTSVKSASWRAGGVRTAVDAGLEESLIMEFGRWRSNAWRNYLTHTHLDLYAASRAMWRHAGSAPPVSSLRVGGEVSPGPQMRSDDDAVVASVERHARGNR
jgi:hypothetical protein